MQLVSGKEIAQKILDKLKTEVAELNFQPVFCDILVGSDPVSAAYVKIKAKRAEEIGLKFEQVDLPDSVTTEDVVEKIKQLQRDPFLSGLIVQLPLPSGIDRDKVLNAIDLRVDVDSLGQENTKALYEGKTKMWPPTAAAVMAVLDTLKIDLTQQHFLVIGQGDLVGKPVAAILKQKGYNVSTADQTTSDLNALTTSADVIICGTGQAKLIKADMIRDQAILIDCGTSESAGSIVGDVDLESVSSKASVVAPVPGGVGPVTVAKLLENVVEVAKDLQ